MGSGTRPTQTKFSKKKNFACLPVLVPYLLLSVSCRFHSFFVIFPVFISFLFFPNHPLVYLYSFCVFLPHPAPHCVPPLSLPVYLSWPRPAWAPAIIAVFVLHSSSFVFCFTYCIYVLGIVPVHVLAELMFLRKVVLYGTHWSLHTYTIHMQKLMIQPKRNG